MNQIQKNVIIATLVVALIVSFAIVHASRFDIEQAIELTFEDGETMMVLPTVEPQHNN